VVQGLGKKNAAVAYSTYLYLKYNPDRWSLRKENVISRDPEASYFYALEVIKGRWEKGENGISKDLFYSYLYANNVLRGPFYLIHNRLIDEIGDAYIKSLIDNGYRDLVLEYLI